MKLTIAHADTCLSDYWRGDSRPHLQVAAYPRTLASVRAELEGELNAGAIGGSDDLARLLSDGDPAACRAVRAAIRRDVRGARKGQRMAFQDCDPAGDDGDTVWAYFVIIRE
jgi:hypothetical protein